MGRVAGTAASVDHELLFAEDALREAIAVPFERGPDAVDPLDVGADAEDHRAMAAGTVRAIASR